MPRGKVQVKSSSKVGSETEMECYGNDVHRMSPLSSQPEFKKFIPMPEKEPFVRSFLTFANISFFSEVNKSDSTWGV